MGQLKKIRKNAENNPSAMYKRAFNEGREEGIKTTLTYFVDKLQSLNEIEGIGAITYEKITKHIEQGFKR